MSNNDAKTILIVDDDIDFLTQQEIQLKAAGFEVVSAESSSEAIEVFEKDSVDLAVVDLMMEHVDAGFVLCNNLKKKNADFPIILVTGVTAETGLSFDTATEEERSWIKADAMLTKPVRFEQLRREIDRLLDL